ncbi:ABC transporter ATP-binding protein [Salipiger abyssi]|uniref:ABC transporter ATP-binding protein n=1 Tax=Salipiger abyssi TaxID=1250539 RepID=UPI001A8BF981|nr:ABC transporter ATP-binding protein [Salipiger abyssi]MBN9890345.1 ABC transporter ATP-binding protein [Salipiger abyssi]
MLEISNLRVTHGPIEAVHGIDISVPAGTCVALLGANGAGKTSTLSAITGTAKSTGTIRLEGEDISALPVEARVKRGIALSPEGRRVFYNLSVRENLVMGAAIRKDKAAIAEEVDHWFTRFPILGERRDQPAGTLSGGEQQMLAIARALMSRPRILLLDEPSLGLAPQIVERIFEMIRELRSQGVTILLVEQNATAAIGLSDHVYVLNNGLVSSQGRAADYGNGAELMDQITGVHG